MNGLIEDIKQGDRAAFRELFEDYYPILCVFAMKYIRDEEQCKDVAQETLLTYWQNRADFEDIFKVKGYLYRVARNRCLNMIRREQVDEHFVKEALTESEAYFENEVIRQETYLLVRKAVGALPVQMRKIIELAMQGRMLKSLPNCLYPRGPSIPSRKLPIKNFVTGCRNISIFYFSGFKALAYFLQEYLKESIFFLYMRV